MCGRGKKSLLLFAAGRSWNILYKFVLKANQLADFFYRLC